jgi:hypothetical protein
MPMSAATDLEKVSYPVFKGLQKPLEFMGIQGRYIYWAAAAAGGAIIGFIIGYCLLGLVAGLILMVIALGFGAALIVLRQRKGLHTKKEDKGVFVYAYSKRI